MTTTATHRREICGKWDDDKDGGCDDPQDCQAKADTMYAQLVNDESFQDMLIDNFGISL